MILFIILITLYVGLKKDEIALWATLFGIILFFTVRGVRETDVELDPGLNYEKASISRFGIKLSIPRMDKLQSRHLQLQTYMSNNQKIEGGMVFLYEIYSCPCGAEDYVLLKPYPKKELNNPDKTNILDYLDHKLEPRSAPQIRRMLRSFGIIDDPSEIANRIYAKMVMSRTSHTRWRVRTPITRENANPVIE